MIFHVFMIIQVKVSMATKMFVKHCYTLQKLLQTQRPRGLDQGKVDK